MKYMRNVEPETLIKSRNIQLLSDLTMYPSDVDADLPTKKVSENALHIVSQLIHQPEIFKTGRNSLHLQFDLQDKSYMELEVFEDRMTCMIVPEREYDKAIFPNVSLNDMNHLNELVDEFYGDDNFG